VLYTGSLEAAGQALPQDKKGKQEIQKNRRGASNGYHAARQTQHWEPPLDGWVKLNVDGSYHELTGEAGVGVVARDRCGTVIFTAWKYFEKCGSAAEAEIIALCGRSSLGKSLGSVSSNNRIRLCKSYIFTEKPTGGQVRDRPNCRGVEKFDSVDE